MCLSCGCDVVYDNHGKYGNITMQTIMDAAQASGIDPDDVINNIENTYARFVDHDFQDVDDSDSGGSDSNDSD